MKRNKPLIPKYNIGDYVGTEVRSNQWCNEWYADGSKIAKIAYGYVPYQGSGNHDPRQQFVYTLESGKVIGELSIPKLS